MFQLEADSNFKVEELQIHLLFVKVLDDCFMDEWVTDIDNI